MSAVGSSGNFIGSNLDPPAGADAERGRKELAVQMSAAIEYLDDKAGKAAGMSAGDHRIAKVTCGNCPSCLEQHQSQVRVGEEWLPSIGTQLSLFGWQTDGERWYCGKTCAAHYAVKMRDHGDQPLPTVERVGDASYAKRMYATEPLEGVTPAAPPAKSRARRAT